MQLSQANLKTDLVAFLDKLQALDRKSVEPEVFQMWKFKKTDLSINEIEKNFRNFANQKSLFASVQLTCHGCVAVIVAAPRWTWAHLDLIRDDIRAHFGNDISSISTLNEAMVRELLERKDNEEFSERLETLMEILPNYAQSEYVIHRTYFIRI